MKGRGGGMERRRDGEGEGEGGRDGGKEVRREEGSVGGRNRERVCGREGEREGPNLEITIAK